MSRVFEVGGTRSATVTDVAEPTRRYAVLGYATEPDAVAAFVSYATSNSLLTFGGLLLDEVNPTESETAPGNWTVEATWRPFRQKAPTQSSETYGDAEPEFNFSFALSSEKVYVPLKAQVVHRRTADAVTAPTIALIGDQGDGKPPAGVDILVPEISFAEKRYLAQSYWTEAVRNNFLRMIGKVNTTPFRSFDPGEVLCAGISGAARGRDDMELQFAYRVRENSTVEQDGFTDFDKLGWQYLWPRHYLEAQGDENVVTNKIQYLVLSDVYPEADFSILE